MRKLIAFFLAVCLCLSLSVTCFAASVSSNQGGNTGNGDTAPRTGSAIVAVLALTVCAAGGVGVVSYKKSQK